MESVLILRPEGRSLALRYPPHTAATHLQKIYKRLGVSSRAELTRWLIEQE